MKGNRQKKKKVGIGSLLGIVRNQVQLGLTNLKARKLRLLLPSSLRRLHSLSLCFSLWMCSNFVLLFIDLLSWPTCLLA